MTSSSASLSSHRDWRTTIRNTPSRVGKSRPPYDYTYLVSCRSTPSPRVQRPSQSTQAASSPTAFRSFELNPCQLSAVLIFFLSTCVSFYFVYVCHISILSCSRHVLCLYTSYLNYIVCQFDFETTSMQQKIMLVHACRWIIYFITSGLYLDLHACALAGKRT